MNITRKATLLAVSLIFLSGAGADTNEMVKQIKSWGTDLERRLETAEDNNAKLQKQLDKMSTQLQSTEADRDTLKDDLVQSRRALKAAEKAAEIANRRAEKADRELARADERAKRDAAKLVPDSKPAVAATPVAKPMEAPSAAPAMQKPGSGSDAVTVIEVPAMKSDEAPALTPAAPVKAAAAPAENLPIIVDGVLIPATPAAAVKELPKAPEKMLKENATSVMDQGEENVKDMMTTEDDDTE